MLEEYRNFLLKKIITSTPRTLSEEVRDALLHYIYKCINFPSALLHDIHCYCESTNN